jgi:asparaginyl-tRNA synthetase
LGLDDVDILLRKPIPPPVTTDENAPAPSAPTFEPISNAALKKAKKGVEVNKKKKAKEAERLEKEKQVEEARLKELEKAKKIVIANDPSLPQPKNVSTAC